MEKMKDIYYGKKVLYCDGTYVMAHFEVLGEIFFPWKLKQKLYLWELWASLKTYLISSSKGFKRL